MEGRSKTRKATPNAWGTGGGQPVLYLLDDIGPKSMGMISASWVREELKAMAPGPVHVVCNITGGDAFEALAIYDALASRNRVRFSIIGAAAGAAAILPMAAEEIAIAQSAFMMLENPRIVALGEESDLRMAADMLDIVCQEAVAIIGERTGLAAKEVGRLMDEQTCFNARTAAASGLANSVIPNKRAPAKLKALANRVRLAELESEVGRDAGPTHLKIL